MPIVNQAMQSVINTRVTRPCVKYTTYIAL